MHEPDVGRCPSDMAPIPNSDIDAIETQLGHKLPGLYRKLLIEIGYGSDGSKEIYHPAKIRELYQYHFEDTGDLFTKWFPFGCNNATQELWIIDAGAEKVASIWHETHPDDYEDEEWTEYDEWIVKHLPQ